MKRVPLQPHKRTRGSRLSNLVSLVMGGRPDEKNLSATADSVDDGEGQRVEVHFESFVPDGGIAYFSVFQQESVIGGVEGFSIGDEQFSVQAPVAAGRCACYIPNAALVGSHAGPALLYVTVIFPVAGTAMSVGGATFHIELGQSATWSRPVLVLPAIRLLMGPPLAGGEMFAQQVQALRTVCEEHFDIRPEHDNELRSVLQRVRSELENASLATLRDVAERFLVRFPNEERDSAAGWVIDVVLAGGSPSGRMIRAAKTVIRGLGLNEQEWKELASLRGIHEQPSDDGTTHLRTLGLKTGASTEEVRQAYRTLIKQYHPDVYARAPEEFRVLAQRRSIELREAYEALLDMAK
jgi:DnaJ-domain-containing protein 1